MINLLPSHRQKDLRAARTNTILVRYNVVMLIASVFMAIAISIVYVFLISIRTSAENAIADNQTREQSYAEVKSQAQAFNQELADAKTILDSEVSYSKALVEYAKLFPEGTAVNAITLSEATFGAPIEETVRITGEEAAQALIQSMTSSPFVSGFERKSIAITDDNTYPYTMTISFTLSKEIAL